MSSKSTTIRCSVCKKGTLQPRVVTHDVGHLLGLPSVVVDKLRALVCSDCGEITLEGAMLDQISLLVAARILEQPKVAPVEIRYLRRLLGYTQEQLAEKLDVTRATVNRWEVGDKPVTGLPAYSVRSHAFFKLRGRSRAVEQVASSFEETPKPSEKKQSYTIEGPSFPAAAS